MKPKLKFKYNSPRNDRIKNNGIWFQVWANNEYWSYMIKTKRWERDGTKEFEEAKSEGFSNCEHGKSFKKFKRRLRKQPELIGKLVYCTRYYHKEKLYGYEIKSII
jgi:hypothetical protein